MKLSCRRPPRVPNVQGMLPQRCTFPTIHGTLSGNISPHLEFLNAVPVEPRSDSPTVCSDSIRHSSDSPTVRQSDSPTVRQCPTAIPTVICCVRMIPYCLPYIRQSDSVRQSDSPTVRQPSSEFRTVHNFDHGAPTSLSKVPPISSLTI